MLDRGGSRTMPRSERSEGGLRGAQRAAGEEVIAEWATYLAQPPRFIRRCLPAGVRAERLGDGMLIVSSGPSQVTDAFTARAIHDELPRRRRRKR